MSGWPRCAPRERSALAYASGFAGVLYLFRYSLAPLALSPAGLLTDVAAALFLLTSMSGPLALALAFAAAASLDRSPEKSGVLPALFGVMVGMWGTVAWLVLRDPVWELLARTP